MTNPNAGRIGKMRVDGRGRYHDGVRSWQRTSNLLKNIETDTYHLDEWRGNTLAIGLASRADLVLGVAAAAQFDPATGKLTDEAKSTLRGLRKQATDAAKSKAGSNAGTAVHTATERFDVGESVESIGLPYPYNADLKAYETLVRAMGLSYRPEHIERTVRNTEVDCAGTFDRIGASALLVERGVLAPDELLVVDVKTESAPLFNLMHIAPQLATYANGDGMFVPGPLPDNEYAGTYEPMPNVSKLVGLVIHVRDGRAVPYLVNLAAGWDSAQRAHAQREAIKASKVKLGDEGCWALAVPVDLPPATELTADAHARGPLGYSAPAGTTVAQYVAPAETVVVEEAVRGADGMVTWNVVPDGDPRGARPALPAGPQPLEAMTWEEIQRATSIDELSGIFERATARGVQWEGPIAEAGITRGRIVTCVQRAMHDPSTTAKCACGWARGMAP